MREPNEGVLKRYKEFLPISPNTPLLTLGEGSTPLVRAETMGKDFGCSELYFKLEGCNPTGSFKDRGMVVAAAKALEKGTKAIICASTGNTSASAAAYGAKCNLSSIVVVPKGNVALGKLAQAIAYGAKVLLIRSKFDKALELVRELADRNQITLVNSVNPYRIEGQKTAAFEIVDDLGNSPDYLFIPVGNAGNISAYWKGFKEYKTAGMCSNTPKMMGFQADGADPIVRGKPIADPNTVASAIRIGNPASWQSALKAREESRGVIESVSDQEIIDAYKDIAQREGIFTEPASAASVAGVRKLVRSGLNLKGKKVVCVLTGTGLKDPELARETADADLPEVSPEIEALEEYVTSI